MPKDVEKIKPVEDNDGNINKPCNSNQQIFQMLSQKLAQKAQIHDELRRLDVEINLLQTIVNQTASNEMN